MLWVAILDFLWAVKDLVWALGLVLLPWAPLAAWLVFWLFAVNWTKLRPTLVHQGGWVGVLLIAVVWIIVWGVVNPPPGGYYDLFGLHIGNFMGKTVYVTGLLCLMLLAGAAQLSGAVACCATFPEETVELASADHGHGHDDHGHGAHDAGHAAADHAHH